MYRCSRPEVFCKKRVLRNLAQFTAKHLCKGFLRKKCYNGSLTRNANNVFHVFLYFDIISLLYLSGQNNIFLSIFKKDPQLASH